MIILITGKPGIGKSTLIQKLIDSYDKPMEWVVTQELRSEGGQRVGFQAINSAGETATISHKHTIESNTVIGENKVDVEAIDQMFSLDTLIEKLLLVDEIGPIQLLSSAFAQSLQQLLRNSPTKLLVATIHQSDTRLAQYRNAKDIMLVTVSEKNRDFLPSALISVLNAHPKIDNLLPAWRERFLSLAGQYLDNNQPVQLHKLLNNALLYIESGRVLKVGADSFIIAGNHGDHHVTKEGDTYVCDCDLFNGRGVYSGKAGICSHIQAAGIVL